MIGIRMSSAVRLDYLKALFAQSIHVLDSMPSGSAATTITTTANTLQLGISEKVGILIEFTAMIIGSIVIAFTKNWLLTLVTMSGILFIMVALGALLPLIIQGSAKMTKAEGKATAVASEALSSIRMIAACGAEARVKGRYEVWSDLAKKYGQQTSPLIALQFGLIFFALYGMFGLAFWYGTKSYLDGRVHSVGEIVVVLMSVMMTVMSMERLSSPLITAGKAMVAACEFFTVIDAPLPPKGHLKEPDVSAVNDINFKDVHFAYPSRPHVKVLDGLNLNIEAGKLTAIVGPSGSGKSTIVGLIQRWYNLDDQYVIAKTIDPEKVKKQKEKEKKREKRMKKGLDVSSSDDEEDDIKNKEDEEQAGPPIQLSGAITSGGTPLSDIELRWWRTQIGLVQQEPFLFNDTIFSNVANGLIGTVWENESEEKKRELVKEACKESFADEFIDRLPDVRDQAVLSPAGN